MTIAWIVASTWFGLCCFAQLPRGRHFITARLVPGWAFFGPNPPQADVHVLFRDEPARCDPAAWQEVALTRSSGASPLPWRSLRRHVKAVEQAANTVVSARTDPTDTAAYQTLCRLVDHAGPVPTASHRRFMLARATFEGATRHVRVLYVSEPYVTEGSGVAYGRVLA